MRLRLCLPQLSVIISDMMSIMTKAACLDASIQMRMLGGEKVVGFPTNALTETMTQLRDTAKLLNALAEQLESYRDDWRQL